jgi:tocopherol O-methyltransferase
LRPEDPLLDHVARYYSDATEYYARYGGESGGWHYGIWQRGVRTHQQALVRSNELLVRGLRLTAKSRLLDVGCGGGGFAVWAASRFGCRVTGVTTCGPHIELARRLARQRGLGRLCRFVESDMQTLDLPLRSFDFVVNQETLCCADDKERALSEIYRVLVPGGRWRAIDFALAPKPLSRRAKAWYQQVLDGFHMTSMTTREEVRTLVDALGFVRPRARDLGRWVRPSARDIVASSRLPVRLAERFPDAPLFSGHRIRERNLRGHFSAGHAFSEGLLTGDFRLEYYAAERPK